LNGAETSKKEAAMTTPTLDEQLIAHVDLIIAAGKGKQVFGGRTADELKEMFAKLGTADKVMLLQEFERAIPVELRELASAVKAGIEKLDERKEAALLAEMRADPEAIVRGVAALGGFFTPEQQEQTKKLCDRQQLGVATAAPTQDRMRRVYELTQNYQMDRRQRQEEQRQRDGSTLTDEQNKPDSIERIVQRASDLGYDIAKGNPLDSECIWYLRYGGYNVIATPTLQELDLWLKGAEYEQDLRDAEKALDLMTTQRQCNAK
jgi:hypothetical protein